jgi:hypothetical protein
VKVHKCYLLKLTLELQAEIVVSCAGYAVIKLSKKFGWYREQTSRPMERMPVFLYPKLVRNKFPTNQWELIIYPM